MLKKITHILSTWWVLLLCDTQNDCINYIIYIYHYVKYMKY